jgi:hypothetical protein
LEDSASMSPDFDKLARKSAAAVDCFDGLAEFLGLRVGGGDARRHDHQRAGPRPGPRTEHNARPLPARLRPHRLPRTTMRTEPTAPVMPRGPPPPSTLSSTNTVTQTTTSA